MSMPRSTHWLRIRLIHLLYGVAIAVGAKYGYDFGLRISGTLLGAVLALNGALFCALIVGMIDERLGRRKATEPAERKLS